MKKMRNYALAGMLVLLASCSFDYDQQLLSPEEKDAIPDVRLEQVSQRVYQNSDKVIELTADELRTYEQRRIQEIDAIRFIQYDEEGEQQLTGNADFASLDLESDDILLRGSVELHILENDARIYGDEFYYSPSQDLIWATAGTEVRLISDNGTETIGRGFIVDLLLGEIRFDGGARGRIRRDE